MTLNLFYALFLEMGDSLVPAQFGAETTEGENAQETTREALSIQPAKLKVAQVSKGVDRNNLCSNPGVHPDLLLGLLHF